MPSPPSDRCDFRLEAGLSGQDISSERCGRPVWEDHDRCIWHVKVDGKTIDTFEDARPERETQLDGAYLREASLVGVDWFSDVSLVGADLSAAEISATDFSGSNMMLTRLTDASAINTDFSRTNLEGAILTNADLRRATLEDARLSGTVLTDVHISDQTVLDEETIYDRDSVGPELSDDHPLEASSWAYRQLQQLYRENSLPRLARGSYIKEKDARRRLAWATRDYRRAVISELSRWVTLYGSSPYRILLTSLLVITASAFLYPLTGGIQEVQGDRTIKYAISDPEATPGWWAATVLFKSLYFSVVTFATLGYGDIQPIGGAARLLAGVETILGSLLTALLVFVLARIVTW